MNIKKEVAMEKRKSKLEKILMHFDEIVEEKLTLEDNLKRMIDKIFSYVEHVKNSIQSMKQTDVSEVLKYELEILTKVTDMNSELEELLERDSINTSVVLKNTSKFTGDVLVKQEMDTECNDISGSSRDFGNIILQDAIYETPPSDQTESAEDHSFSTNRDSAAIPIEQKQSLTESDLQTLRESLRNFSLKLGLNEESLSSHEKPCTDCVGDVPHIPYQCIIVPESISDSDSLELPVRDLNTSGRKIESANDCDEPGSILEECSKPNNLNIDNEQTYSASDETSNESVNCQMYEIEENSDVKSSPFESCHNTSQSTFNTPVSLSLESNHSSAKLNNQSPPDKSVLMKKKENSSKKNSPSKHSTKWKKNCKLYELRPKKTPSVGDECMFSHIVSPSEFYVHILDDETVSIDDLANRIHQNYNRSLPTHTSKRLAFSDMGQFCLAFVSQYNSWFRAEVLNWYLDEQSDDVLIQLVDYGTKKSVTYQNLRKMVEELANVPKLAVRCHFPLMYAPSSTRLDRSYNWPEETIKALVDVSGSSEHEEKQDVTFKIVYAFQEENSLAVDLYNPLEENEELTVGQILLDLGLAKQIVEEYDEDNMDLEVFLDDVDQLETADNINEAVAGYDARDEARICRFTRKDGTCFKGKNCKLEHVSLPKDGFTTDTELIFKEAMYSLSLPTCGESVTVLVTCYIDICRFFVQIIDNPLREAKYVIDRAFYSVMSDLNSPNVIKTYESFKILPAIGEIVVAKHWTKKWLRAVVRELVNVDDSETTEIHVFTVDVGETLKANLKDLRKIKPHLLKVPFQAVECYIHDFKMRDDCSPEKAKAFFDKNLYFHNFTALVKSSCLPLKISLRSLNGLTDIGKKLEEHNFAEARIRDDNPSDDCFIKLY